jgi:hypothetical protein
MDSRNTLARAVLLVLIGCLAFEAARIRTSLLRIRSYRAALSVSAAPAPRAAASDGTRTASAKARPGKPAPRSASLALFKALKDPGFLRTIAVAQRQTIADHYRGLFETLRLDPAAKARFVDLLVEKQIVKSEAEGAAYDHGLYGTDGVIPAITAAQADVNAQISALLGPQGYQDYYNFEMTDGIRTTLERLQELMRYTPEPIPDSTVEQMVSTLDQATPPAERGGISKFTGLDAAVAGGLTSLAYSSPLPDDAPALLGPTLSQSQLARLQELMADQKDELRLRSVNLAAIGSPADPPSP